MAHVGDEALLNRQSSRIEQFCGFQVWFNWFCCVLLFPGCIWPCCEEWSENESDLYLLTKVPWRTCFTRIYKPNCWV